MSTLKERMALRAAQAAEEARLTRVAAAFPAVGSTPIFPTPPAEINPLWGSSFKQKVDSIIARFKTAGKHAIWKALDFFEDYGIEGYSKGALGSKFGRELPWVVDQKVKWITQMTGIIPIARARIVQDLKENASADVYGALTEAMNLFETKVIDNIKLLFPRDPEFPNRFFTDLLNQYEISDKGRAHLAILGGKRRKTRKVRKSKRRQTKLRIKKRLIMS